MVAILGNLSCQSGAMIGIIHTLLLKRVCLERATCYKSIRNHTQKYVSSVFKIRSISTM